MTLARIFGGVLFFIWILQAQGTREDYTRAAKLISRDPSPFDGQVHPTWIERTDRFSYRRVTTEGFEFVIVDPQRQERKPVFDHARMAAELSRAASKTYPGNKLPIDRLEIIEKDNAVLLDIEGTRWKCSLVSYDCRNESQAALPGQFPPPQSMRQTSPDGKWMAYQKNHNIHIRSTATGEEIQLSFDGSEKYDYSASLPGLQAMVRAQTSNVEVAPSVKWSPDSRRLLGYRLDRRSAREFTVVQSVPTNQLRPLSFTYPYPLPGEVGLSRAEPVIFDVVARKQIDIKIPPLDLLYTGGPQLRWYDDSRRAHFVYTKRGYQNVELREIDAATGETPVLVAEKSETFVDPGMTYYRILEETGEVLWSSERDGWCHLYLYDLSTGHLKRQLTKGEWVVRDILHVDQKTRRVWFAASGRESGRDPYLVHVYRVNLDGTELRVLTPEDAEHSVSFSPSGKYFADNYSRINTAPVAVVRNAEDGSIAMELEKPDLKPLLESGWKWPEPFKVLAADGKTDLYGVMFIPSTFDQSKKYPVIESIYTGPQAYVTPKTFRARSPAQALAELGFIVVVLDGRGMGKRSKAFHDFCYKNLGGDVRLADHIAGIKQLAERNSHLDMTRVGVIGHSAGGYDAANAILNHPEFYKVAVSSAGNHDHRMDKAWWNELWMGFPVGDHYGQQSNVKLAPKLQGKLLLAHGELDDNVHPASTLQLVDALIKANKDFDLLILPGQNHGLGMHPYFLRRVWDFFVRHLLSIEPPREFSLQT